MLDVGAGSGTVAGELLALGIRLVLLDVVDQRDRPVPAAPFVLGDGCALPFRDGVLGGVHLGRVIHHVPDWRAALGESARVLAARGVIAVGTGGHSPDGVLGALVDRFYAATDAAGYRSLHGHSPHDMVEVDEVMTGLGFGPPEVVEQSWLVEHRPAELLAGRVRSRYRWEQSQDRSGLPELADRILSESGLDPDVPVAGRHSATYRLYRRIRGF